MAGFDIISVLNTILHYMWLAIEIPFRVWNHVPWYIKTLILLFFGAIGLYMCWMGYKDRELWRHRYID